MSLSISSKKAIIDRTNSSTWAAGVRHTKPIGHMVHRGGVPKNEGKKKWMLNHNHTRKKNVLKIGLSISFQMSSDMVGPRCDTSAHNS